jgi:hypothetical protein
LRSFLTWRATCRAFSEAVLPARGDFVAQLAVLLTPVEQAGEASFFVRECQQKRSAAADRHIALHGLERLAARVLLRQQVHTVAQHGSAASLQRPPGTHTFGRVGRGECQHKKKPIFHVENQT